MMQGSHHKVVSTVSRAVYDKLAGNSNNVHSM